MTGVTPSPGKGTFTAFGARHVKGVAVSRWVAAVCFVIAGALVMAFGHWWGLVFFRRGRAERLAQACLGPAMPNLLRDASKNVERVRELQRSRALLMDDAATRLRRIEQDLHDGAQAQMVAVVMKLGLARDQQPQHPGCRASGPRLRPGPGTGRRCPPRRDGGDHGTA